MYRAGRQQIRRTEGRPLGECASRARPLRERRVLQRAGGGQAAETHDDE